MTHFPQDILSHIVDFLKPRPNPAYCMDTVPELKEMCRIRGLRVGGNKLALINRLLERGCYARRAFWDTPSGDSKPIQPMLTFKQELHTLENWTEEARRLQYWSNEWIKCAAYHEWIAERTLIASYSRIYRRFVNASDKHWPKKWGARPREWYWRGAPHWTLDTLSREINPERIAWEIEEEGKDYFLIEH